MATFADRKFGFALRWRSAERCWQFASIGIWATAAIRAGPPTLRLPRLDGLERITEFFNNESATG